MWRAASAHSRPLFPWAPPARSRAWAIFSQVRTPNSTGHVGRRRDVHEGEADPPVDVLVVRRFAADDGAEADHGGVDAAVGEPTRGERDFPRAGDPRYVDAVVGHAGFVEPRDGAGEQFVGDGAVPLGDDDGEALVAGGRRDGNFSGMGGMSIVVAGVAYEGRGRCSESGRPTSAV